MMIQSITGELDRRGGRKASTPSRAPGGGTKGRKSRPKAENRGKVLGELAASPFPTN